MADAASSSNSPSQLLDQFKDICAVDTDTARHFLSGSNWNLEAAVHSYFHSNDPEAIENDDNARNEQESIRRRNVGSFSRTADVTSNPDTTVSRPRQSQVATWSSWFRALLAMPFRFAYYSLREIFLFIYSLFGGNLLAITNPQEDLQKFMDQICAYPNNDLIPWYSGTYNEAINEAKASVRFMLVYLHNPSHQSTEDFVRNVILTPAFSNFVRDNDIVMWGTDVRTHEGYKVAASLHELTYPCLALICMRDNRMACVLRVSGLYALTAVLQGIQTAMDENRRFLNAILHERATRDLNNRLRREQEEEYQRALEQDRAKMNERRRLESERAEAARREQEEQQNLLEKKQRLSQIRERLKNELTQGTITNGESIRVSVRFPSGAKLYGTFSADDSLEKLFNHVLIHEACPDDFSLVTSYPRVHLKCSPPWYREFSSLEENFVDEIMTFRKAGLENSLVVMVRDNEA